MFHNVNLPSLAAISVPQQPLLAFADFNSDKHTDLVVQDAVLLWDGADFGKKLPIKHGFTHLVNAVPGDFDRDGKMDLLLMNKGINVLEMAVFFGDEKIDIPSAAGSIGQPFLVDFNGTMQTQLLGYPQSSPKQLSLWSISSDRTVHVEAANLIDKISGKSMCTFSSPHSNAFLDLNGDCLADLFVTCTNGKGRDYFQIWTNSRDDGFSLSVERDFPPSVSHGPVSFADMDGDGTIDIVFATCDSRDSCAINILFNVQRPICTSGSSSPFGGANAPNDCLPITNLCVADPKFTVGTVSLKIELKDVLHSTDESMDVAAMPLRLGDYDKDGYPDIMILTRDKSRSYIRLLQSIPCTKLLCPKTDRLDHHRYYKSIISGMEEINSLEGLKTGAAFFDINEDGALDILVFTQDSKKLQHVSVFQNKFYSDGFFLKSLVLNGVCPAWCPSGTRFPDPKPYGVNYFGATIKYTVTDPTGQKRATQLSQMPQSSYFALNLPYVLSGLGRTNNYIETLFVGATKQKADNVATYFGVIPNSQLVIIPYEADNSGPDSWKLELFINPSTLAPWVFVSLLSTLVALSGVVVFLHYLERKEDHMERRTNIHNINFDAL